MELARLAAAVDDPLLLQLLHHPHSPPQSATTMVPKRRPQPAHHLRLHRLWLKPLHEQQQLEQQRLAGRAQPLDGRTTSGLLVITTSTSTAASGRTTQGSPQRQATAQPRLVGRERGIQTLETARSISLVREGNFSSKLVPAASTGTRTRTGRNILKGRYTRHID